METGLFSLGLLVGLVIGIAIIGAGMWWMIKREKEHKPFLPWGVSGPTMVAALLVVSALAMAPGGAKLAFAQEDTPVPLVIPINAIFTQANNWLSTLSPIASLGIGIIIALAVFGFLSKAIKSAFG